MTDVEKVETEKKLDDSSEEVEAVPDEVMEEDEDKIVWLEKMKALAFLGIKVGEKVRARLKLRVSVGVRVRVAVKCHRE